MKALLIYSGGMDSYTLLHELLMFYEPSDIETINFYYGQRHAKELMFARKVTQRLGIRNRCFDLPMFEELPQVSALTNDSLEMPVGHFAGENMRQTVVPGRNSIMLAVAAAYAEALHKQVGASSAHHIGLYYAAHRGDHYIYPDCRPEFVEAMREAIRQSSNKIVELHAPFIHMTKSDIAMRGAALKLDYGNTWTCYVGGDRPCGVCGSCDERREALAAAGLPDPLLA